MTDADRPALRVVRGEPSAEELAAVVAVLAARAAPSGQSEEASGRSAWSRGAGLRGPLPSPGPGAWQAAARGR